MAVAEKADADGRGAWLAAALFVGFLVLWGFAARLLHGEDLAFPKLGDDAFYYFDVAVGWWAGEGLSTDGLHPTNGVQPLWMGVVLGLAGLAGSNRQLLWMVIGVQAALVFVVVGLLYRLVAPRAGRLGAFVMLAFLMFPRYINVNLIGLEGAVTALALVAALSLLVDGRVLERPARFADAGAGTALGLLMLARLDSVFILAALCIAVLWLHGVRGEGSPGQRAGAAVRKALALFWPTLPLVLPYLAYNVVVFDHLLPISGAVKSTFPDPNLGWSRWWWEYKEYVVLLPLAAAGVWVAARDARQRALALPLGCMVAGAAVHWLHTVLFMHWAVFHWHFSTYVPLGAIGAGLLAGAVLARVARPLRLAAVTAFSLVILGGVAYSIAKGPVRFPLASREGARWSATLPEGTRLAMRDSGVFGFESPHAVTNLDGIISNFQYQDAICDGELRSYLKGLGIDYIVYHAGPAGPGYGVFGMKVHCRFEPGRYQVLQLDEADEVYRTAPYTPRGGRPQALTAWRLR